MLDSLQPMRDLPSRTWCIIELSLFCESRTFLTTYSFTYFFCAKHFLILSSTKVKVSSLFPQTLHRFDAGLSATHAETSQPELGISLSCPCLVSPKISFPHILLLTSFCVKMIRLTSFSSLVPLCMARVSSTNSGLILACKHQCQLHHQPDLPHPNGDILLIPKDPFKFDGNNPTFTPSGKSGLSQG